MGHHCGPGWVCLKFRGPHSSFGNTNPCCLAPLAAPRGLSLDSVGRCLCAFRAVQQVYKECTKTFRTFKYREKISHKMVQHNHQRGPREGNEINLIQSNHLFLSCCSTQHGIASFRFIHAQFYLQYIELKSPAEGRAAWCDCTILSLKLLWHSAKEWRRLAYFFLLNVH